MLRVSIKEAPIRMGSVGRRICSRGIFLFFLGVAGFKTATCRRIGLDYTDLCN
jgi:hypothetical protein